MFRLKRNLWGIIVGEKSMRLFNKFINKIAILTMAFIVCFSAILFIVFYKVNDFPSDISYTITGWEEASAEYSEDGLFPERMEYKSKLPEDIHDYTHIYIIAYYSDIELYLGDRLIYADGKSEDNHFLETNSERYMFINLPDDWKGKDITLVTYPHMDTRGYELKEPVLCWKDTMLQVLYQAAIPMFIIVMVIAVMGVLYIIYYFNLRKTATNRSILLFIGIIAIQSGIYIVSQMAIASIMSRNTSSLYILEMGMSLIMVFPHLMIVKSYVNEEVSKILNMALALNILNIVVQVIIASVSSISYRMMLPVTHMVYIISLLVILAVTISGIGVDKKAKLGLRLTFVPVCIMWMISLVFNFIHQGNRYPAFVLCGTVYILIVHTLANLGNLRTAYAKQAAATVYEELAYLDMLTGLKNRNAYEKDAEAVKEEAYRMEDKSLIVVAFAVNGLKEVNDNYGHMAGDALIKSMAFHLKEDFDDCENIYRVGGDEFLMFVETNDGQAVVDRIEKMRLKAAKKAFFEDLTISFSYGAIRYDKSLFRNFDDAIKEADTRMYEQKIRYYEESGDKDKIKLSRAKI